MTLPRVIAWSLQVWEIFALLWALKSPTGSISLLMEAMSCCRVEKQPMRQLQIGGMYTYIDDFQFGIFDCNSDALVFDGRIVRQKVVGVEGGEGDVVDEG